MKKSKLEKIFIKTLEKTSIISIACEKVGLSRQTVYRWTKEDLKFKLKVDQALHIGIESINDLAESKLISNIKNNNQRSIEYWLNNHRNKASKNSSESHPSNPKMEEPLTWIIRDYKDRN